MFVNSLITPPLGAVLASYWAVTQGQARGRVSILCHRWRESEATTKLANPE
jgi:hypothetical protein